MNEIRIANRDDAVEALMAAAEAAPEVAEILEAIADAIEREVL